MACEHSAPTVWMGSGWQLVVGKRIYMGVRYTSWRDRAEDDRREERVELQQRVRIDREADVLQHWEDAHREVRRRKACCVAVR